MMEATKAAGVEYGNQLRLACERYEKLPQLQQIQAWVADQRQLFAQNQYGDTLGATNQLLSTFEYFPDTFAKHSEVRRLLPQHLRAFVTHCLVLHHSGC